MTRTTKHKQFKVSLEHTGETLLKKWPKKFFLLPSWCYFIAAKPPKFDQVVHGALSFGVLNMKGQRVIIWNFLSSRRQNALKKWKTEYVKLVKLTVFSLSLKTVFFFRFTSGTLRKRLGLCGKHSVVCAKLHYRLTAIVNSNLCCKRASGLERDSNRNRSVTKSDTNSTCLNLLLRLKVGNTI